MFHDYICDLPTYKVGKPLELLMRDYGIPASDVVKLGSNENPLGSSPLVYDEIVKSVKLSSVYPDDSYYELKDLLSSLYGVKAENIIIGSGSDQILEFCVHATCNKDSSVLMAKTTFAMYEIYAKHCNARVLKTQDFSHNLDSMLDYYKKYSPSIIFLCTPNNPLGEAMLKKDVLSFLSKIDSNTLVILDCAYMEYAAYASSDYHIAPLDIVSYPNVIYLGTFSKVYGLGGMRVGYGIANSNIIEMLGRLRAPFNITNISLKAAIASMKDKEFIQKSLENNFSEMPKYRDFANKYSINMLSSYANFVTFMFDESLISKDISESLLRKGVIVRDLSSYNLNGIRITIGTPAQNERVFQELSLILS